MLKLFPTLVGFLISIVSFSLVALHQTDERLLKDYLKHVPKNETELKLFLEDENLLGDKANWEFVNGTTPLMNAAKMGALNIVQILLTMGADPMTPLPDGLYRDKRIKRKKTLSDGHHNAIDRKRGEKIKTVNYGPRRKSLPDNVKKTIVHFDEDSGIPGSLALHFAAHHNQAQIASLLIHAGPKAQISTVDKNGDTALHISIAKESYETFMVLINGPLDGIEKELYDIDLKEAFSIKNNLFINPPHAVLLSVQNDNKGLQKFVRDVQLERAAKMISVMLDNKLDVNTLIGQKQEKTLLWHAIKKNMPVISLILTTKGAKIPPGNPELDEIQAYFTEPSRDFLEWLQVQHTEDKTSNELIKAYLSQKKSPKTRVKPKRNFRMPSLSELPAFLNSPRK